MGDRTVRRVPPACGEQFNTTVLDSLAMLRRGGQACLVGFLGGARPLTLEPVFQMPSGTRLSVFASAVVTGTPEFPLSEIPFRDVVDRAASGIYRPSRRRCLLSKRSRRPTG
jgi:NADPH2:quinone reductase